MNKIVIGLSKDAEFCPVDFSLIFLLRMMYRKRTDVILLAIDCVYRYSLRSAMLFDNYTNSIFKIFLRIKRIRQHESLVSKLNTLDSVKSENPHYISVSSSAQKIPSLFVNLQAIWLDLMRSGRIHPVALIRQNYDFAIAHRFDNRRKIMLS